MDPGAEYYQLYLSGDDNGLVELIKTYRDSLIFFLFGILNDIDAAEELAEDVFFHLAVKKPQFLKKSSFKTWLYTIGRNKAFHYLRKKHLRYTPLEELPKTMINIQTPETMYFQREQANMLHQCLCRLNANYYQALWLFYFEDLSTKEVATIMHKSVHSIETILYRARNALREELRKEHCTDEIL